MAKVRAEYKLSGKWKSKVITTDIPKDAHGFTLMVELCSQVSAELKKIVSPGIELRKIQIL